MNSCYMASSSSATYTVVLPYLSVFISRPSSTEKAQSGRKTWKAEMDEKNPEEEMEKKIDR